MAHRSCRSPRRSVLRRVGVLVGTIAGEPGCKLTDKAGECRMQINRFHRFVTALIVAVSVGGVGCGGGAAAEQPAPTSVAADGGAPSGAYESRLPDGTAIRLTFRDGGAVRIAMTEDGKTNSHDGKWVLNGEVILVEGGEGLTMQLSWRGDALVTDFGGATLTFKKV
jgi:hypothetical protein